MERYAVPARRVFDNTYQTMPDTDWNYWNLIKFNETRALRRQFRLAHAQGPVHALRRSRLPARLSRRRRDRSVRQRHRRFPAGELHRLPVLRLRLPVQHSEVQPGHEEGLQVHAVLGPRGRRAGARLHQVMSHRLPALRHQGRHEVPRREARRAASRCVGLQGRRCLRSRHHRRHPRHLRLARHQAAGEVRQPSRQTAHPAQLYRLERHLQAHRSVRRHAGLCRRRDALRLRGAAP